MCLRILWSCELVGWTGESAGNELLSYFASGDWHLPLEPHSHGNLFLQRNRSGRIKWKGVKRAMANWRSEEQSREVPVQKLGKLEPTNAQRIIIRNS